MTSLAMYVNESVSGPVGPDTDRKSAVSRDQKQRLAKLTSLAMTNFIEPSINRLYKVKAPLRGVTSVIFSASDWASSTVGELERSGGLLVADGVSGRVMEFGVTNGRYSRDLLTNVEPREMTAIDTDTMAVVDSNEWGSCVKVLSSDTGQVRVTWGRELNTWTPRGITLTQTGQLVVSNIHPAASSRLDLFAADGRQVRQFGRAVGPGDLVFRSPLSVAADVISGRIFAADCDTACIKYFDPRGSLVGQFGNGGDTGRPAILSQPVSICCDSRGNVVVCDRGTRRVQLFSREGQFLCTLLNFQSTTGSGSSPRWRPVRRTEHELYPMAVALSSPSNRLAVAVEQIRNGVGQFRKLLMYSVSPEL